MLHLDQHHHGQHDLKHTNQLLTVTDFVAECTTFVDCDVETQSGWIMPVKGVLFRELVQACTTGIRGANGVAFALMKAVHA